MKGVSLPINVLVIVVIAIIVLLGIIALYFGGFSPFSTSISVEGVKNAACGELVRRQCMLNPSTMILSDYDIIFDADKSGTITSADTLLALCINFYSRNTDVDCKRLCGCP
jgi:hypothetical protein